MTFPGPAESKKRGFIFTILNHWIWQRLRCRPEEFFLAFRRHVDALNIPPAQWERAYQKARDEIRIQARERQTTFKPFHLQMLAGLKA